MRLPRDLSGAGAGRLAHHYGYADERKPHDRHAGHGDQPTQCDHARPPRVARWNPERPRE